MDEALCRICGAKVAIWELRDASRGGGCNRCEGSPLCARCGHRMKEHSGSFGGPSRKCNFMIPDRDTVAISRCGCPGYVHATGPLAQADFATEDVPVVDTVMPTLRVVDPPSA